MPHAYEDVLVVRDGDARGNRMVVRLTTSAGRRIFAIGVPQPDIEDRLGPTWAYLFECEGVNLVDAGAHGTVSELTDGIETAGYSPRDVDRVIITHGHSDHDGAAFRFVRDAGAELWAHEVYARTLPFDDSRIQRSLKTPLAAQMNAIKSRNGHSPDSGSFWRTEPGYAEAKKAAEVDRRVRGGERVGDMRLMHTPGHSPDELCVALDNVVFTGDHVLPEITPHPTCRVRFTEGGGTCALTGVHRRRRPVRSGDLHPVAAYGRRARREHPGAAGAQAVQQGTVQLQRRRADRGDNRAPRRAPGDGPGRCRRRRRNSHGRDSRSLPQANAEQSRLSTWR